MRNQKREYDQSKDPKLGDDLKIDPRDIRFGYWGSDGDLASVAKSFEGDSSPLLKSKRFTPLGSGTWEEALSTSPAEPGLATFQMFRENSVLSMGGWSDLHPVPVLKALGCQSVIYLTRNGGDTLFGQGVAKRLFRLEDASVSWTDLDAANPASRTLNDTGKPEDQTSEWSMMFNLANPRSSFAGSLAMADGVVCTNWDKFDIANDFTQMIENAYRAPIYIANSATLRPTGLKTPSILHASDAARNLRYAGCIPKEPR